MQNLQPAKHKRLRVHLTGAVTNILKYVNRGGIGNLLLDDYWTSILSVPKSSKIFYSAELVMIRVI